MTRGPSIVRLAHGGNGMAKRQTQSTALVPEVIDIDPLPPDAAVVTTDAGSIGAFVQGLREFFKTASTLETRASERLARARAAVLPTSKIEDDVLIAEVRGATAEIKAIEEHWQITQVATRFHKWTVSGRKRGTEIGEEAKTLFNGLHNRYVENEKRRVAEENERRRIAAEEQARKDREAELARMEEEALKAEASAEGLTSRESIFVNLMLQNFPQHIAATRAGYSHGKDNGATAAARLMGLTKVVKAIEDGRQAQTIRTQATAKREAPLVVETTQEKEQFSTAGRTTWGAEFTSVDLFLAAALDPITRTKYGIPIDIIIDTFKSAVQANKGTVPALNEAGRSLKERVDLWPGVRHTKKTGVV